MDHMYARIYYYYARVAEATGRHADIRAYVSKRMLYVLFSHVRPPALPDLSCARSARRPSVIRMSVRYVCHRALSSLHIELALWRSRCCLFFFPQATLLNELLRNLLHFNLYDQAEKLVANTTFPQGAPNSQHARYMYSLGRIRAIQLEYTAALVALQQAIRKAPQNAAAAGFQQQAHKLLIVIQLLLGEIPERAVFRQRMFRKALLPYLAVTQAVRLGDLRAFQEAVATHSAQFKVDKTFTLIMRCAHTRCAFSQRCGPFECLC